MIEEWSHFHQVKLQADVIVGLGKNHWHRINNQNAEPRFHTAKNICFCSYDKEWLIVRLTQYEHVQQKQRCSTSRV